MPRFRHNLLRRLRADQDGATAVEFGLLGAFMIALILGVLQIGISMQQYNALRAIAAEASRYAVVQYQARNELSPEQIRYQTRVMALAPPYNMPAEGLLITMTQEDESRVDGTVEMKIQIRSQVRSILGFIGMRDYYMNYERPIFLIVNE